MSAWQLPTTVTVDGKPFAIRSDFRAVLDAIAALQDGALTPEERSAAFLYILYPRLAGMEDKAAALTAALEFVNLGHPLPQNQPPKPQLVDWEQDAGLIAPAVDRVLGYSCRRCAYLHWWEFVGAYANIGRGLFAEVVNIRAKRARGKALDKAEQAFARDNAALIALPGSRLTDEEEEFFKRLGV